MANHLTMSCSFNSVLSLPFIFCLLTGILYFPLLADTIFMSFLLGAALWSMRWLCFGLSLFLTTSSHTVSSAWCSRPLTCCTSYSSAHTHSFTVHNFTPF